MVLNFLWGLFTSEILKTFVSEMQLICSVHIMNPQIRQPAESDEQNLVLTNLTMTEMFNLL